MFMQITFFKDILPWLSYFDEFGRKRVGPPLNLAILTVTPLNSLNPLLHCNSSAGVLALYPCLWTKTKVCHMLQQCSYIGGQTHGAERGKCQTTKYKIN